MTKCKIMMAAVVAIVLSAAPMNGATAGDPKATVQTADKIQKKETSWVDTITIAPYGSVEWTKLAGSGRIGAGIYGQAFINDRIAIRLSGESTRWQPNNYFIDKGWADLLVYASVSKSFRLYGLGGFGFSPGRESRVAGIADTRRNVSEAASPPVSSRKVRTGDDVLAHAGLGAELVLAKLGPVEFAAFAQGTLFSSTGEQHGAGIDIGLNIGGARK